MAQDTLLGFPAHTLPYRRGEFSTLSTDSNAPPFGRRAFLLSGVLYNPLEIQYDKEKP